MRPIGHCMKMRMNMDLLKIHIYSNLMQLKCDSRQKRRDFIALTGFPIAYTFWPTSKSADRPIGIGLNLSFGASIVRTATSLSWSNPTTFASYVLWSARVTLDTAQHCVYQKIQNSLFWKTYSRSRNSFNIYQKIDTTI